MQEFRSVILSPKTQSSSQAAKAQNVNGNNNGAVPGSIKRVTPQHRALSEMLANSGYNDEDPFNSSPKTAPSKKVEAARDPFGQVNDSDFDTNVEEKKPVAATKPAPVSSTYSGFSFNFRFPFTSSNSGSPNTSTPTSASGSPAASSVSTGLTATSSNNTPSPSSFSSFFHRRAQSSSSNDDATDKYKVGINNTDSVGARERGKEKETEKPKTLDKDGVRVQKRRSVDERKSAMAYAGISSTSVNKAAEAPKSATSSPKNSPASPRRQAATAPKLSAIPEREGDSKGSPGSARGRLETKDGSKSQLDNSSPTPSEDEEENSIKYKKLEALFNMPTVDIVELRKLCWSGCPNRWRALSWKLLLGYVPASIERREATLARKRAEYEQGISQYFTAELLADTGYESSNLEQIRKDIHRTNPNVPVFQNKIVQGCFERVLYMWAVKHPATGYVQGIDDLVSPFFLVFLSDLANIENPETCDITQVPASLLTIVEADCYGCLCALLDGIQDHYTFAQPGIQRMMFKFKELIHRIDGDLVLHLENQDVNFVQLSFRWMNCFLMREFNNIRLIFRMWDTYFSEPDGFGVFHTYVCASLLLKYAPNLKQLEAEHAMLFIQRLPTSNWTDKDMELLLSHAYMLRTIYHDAQAHFGS